MSDWIKARSYWVRDWDIDQFVLLFALSVTAGFGLAIPLVLALLIFG